MYATLTNTEFETFDHSVKNIPIMFKTLAIFENGEKSKGWSVGEGMEVGSCMGYVQLLSRKRKDRFKLRRGV